MKSSTKNKPCGPARTAADTRKAAADRIKGQRKPVPRGTGKKKAASPGPSEPRPVAPPPGPPMPAMPTVEAVAVADLIRDARLRFRLPDFGDRSDAAAAERYADAMDAYGGESGPPCWGEFPPVVAVRLTEPHRDERMDNFGELKPFEYPAGGVVLVGGFTRVQAAESKAVASCPAFVRSGTWEDAERLAWAENSNHGRPRSALELGIVVNSICARHKKAGLPEPDQRELARLTGTNKNAIWRLLSNSPASPKGREEERATKPPEECSDPADAMRSAGSISSTQGRVVERDLWGRPVEKWHRAKFEGVPELLKTTKRIRDLVISLAVAKHGPDGKETCLVPAYAAADLTQATADVFNILDGLQNVIPWIVCPACDDAADKYGPVSECEVCHQKRYLTKLQTENLTPSLEKKARRWIDQRSGE